MPVCPRSDSGGVQLQEPLSSEQAVLRTSLARRPARRRAPQRRAAGNDDIALFELRMSTSRRTSSCPTNGGISAASRRAASRSRRASSRGSTPRSKIEPSFRAATTICSAPGPRRAHRRGWVGGCTRTCRASGARSSSTSTRSPARAGPDRLRRRHHLSRRPPGSRLHGSPTTCRRASSSPPRGRPPARSCGRCAPSTSTGASRSGPEEVDRLLRHVPVARADPDRRGRRRAAKPHRRGARKRLRRPAPGLDPGKMPSERARAALLVCK